jgi:hypothetical protein
VQATLATQEAVREAARYAPRSAARYVELRLCTIVFSAVAACFACVILVCCSAAWAPAHVPHVQGIPVICLSPTSVCSTARMLFCSVA